MPETFHNSFGPPSGQDCSNPVSAEIPSRCRPRHCGQSGAAERHSDGTGSCAVAGRGQPTVAMPRLTQPMTRIHFLITENSPSGGKSLSANLMPRGFTRTRILKRLEIITVFSSFLVRLHHRLADACVRGGRGVAWLSVLLSDLQPAGFDRDIHAAQILVEE